MEYLFTYVVFNHTVDFLEYTKLNFRLINKQRIANDVEKATRSPFQITLPAFFWGYRKKPPKICKHGGRPGQNSKRALAIKNWTCYHLSQLPGLYEITSVYYF
jgi:hypothetical protein